MRIKVTRERGEENITNVKPKDNYEILTSLFFKYHICKNVCGEKESPLLMFSLGRLTAVEIGNPYNEATAPAHFTFPGQHTSCCSCCV